MQLGWWVVYSLFSLIFAWREQTSVFCWGTRVFGLPITFIADLLCYCNACLKEKLLPRLCSCENVTIFPQWWAGGSQACLSSSGVTARVCFVFFCCVLTGGAVEDSGEAGVLLWVSGGVQCLHHSPGVSGPSPSLRWCRGRTTPPCLGDPLWAPGSVCICVCFHLSPTVNILERVLVFPWKLRVIICKCFFICFCWKCTDSNGWV